MATPTDWPERDAGAGPLRPGVLTLGRGARPGDVPDDGRLSAEYLLAEKDPCRLVRDRLGVPLRDAQGRGPRWPRGHCTGALFAS